METLSFAVQAVLPMGFLMALGIFLRGRRLLKAEFFLAANKLCFTVLLPVMLFMNIIDCFRNTERFDWLYVGITAGGVCLAFLGLMLLTPLFVKDKNRIGVVVQGIYRSNFLIFGVPMVTNMFGSGELWASTMLMPFIIPLFNVFAVVALSWFRNRQLGWRATLLGILRNPLILATLLAFAYILLGNPVPWRPLEKGLRDVAGLASPLALIALGGSLEFRSIGRNARAITAVTLGRLVFMPLLILPAAVALGYRGSVIAAMLAITGSPTAVSSYIMAQQSGNDGELAGQIVAFTTVGSILTIFLWVILLRTLGYL